MISSYEAPKSISVECLRELLLSRVAKSGVPARLLIFTGVPVRSRKSRLPPSADFDLDSDRTLLWAVEEDFLSPGVPRLSPDWTRLREPTVELRDPGLSRGTLVLEVRPVLCLSYNCCASAYLR